jgi:uncharacterized protein (DUF885 family)
MSKWLVGVLVIGVLAGLLLFGPTSTGPSPSLEPPAAAAVDGPGADAWEGLPVDAFLEQASIALVTRYPETVTSLGIGELLGIGDGELAPLSLAYTQETQALEAAIVAHLATYDLEALSDAERMNARVYGQFLTDVVEGHPFADHTYLIHPYITSYPASLEQFLTDTHPVRTQRNAEDYVSRLSQIETRLSELTEALERSEAIGAVPPKFIVELALPELRRTAETAPEASPLYTTFAAKLASSPLSSTRQAELLSQAEAVIADSVLPAYRRLVDFVEALAERASDIAGVWKHENGAAYYDYLLRHYTTTDLSAEEIHEIGLAEVERIQAEIRAAANELGFGESLSFAEIFAQATAETGTASGEESLETCRALLTDIRERIEPVFSRFPREDLIVVAGEGAAFYSPGSLDGSRPGKFYAPAGIETPRYRMPTLTYHEGIPGHHFQIALAHELDLPGYRSSLSFTAFAEGWALYAERLAWELGAYDDDPYGNLGRLQDEIFRAVRLVVDTGIHAMRWTYEEAVAYMIENAGLEEEYVRSQVIRYIVLPGQATAYKVGMLKMLELRDRARSALGDAFDLREFHDRVLREGSVPLVILEELVDEYIAETLADS